MFRGPLADRIRFNSELDSNGCWIWRLRLDKDGYGQISVQNKTRRAHRVAYEALVGEIPEGLELDHLCRVRSCVNPEHLEPVTSKENTLRGESFSAVNARKTHCSKGHELAGDNLEIRGKQRSCRECRRKEARERWRKLNA